MANFSASFTILDGDGDQSVARMNLIAVDITAAVVRAQALAVLINNIVLGQITQILVAQAVTLPGGLRAIPAAGADVEVKLRTIWNAVGGYTTRLSLPTFNKDSYTVVGGLLDTGDVDVIAFTNEIIANGWADSRFADVTALAAGYEAYGR